MDLSWGDGYFDVLLNLEKFALHPYSSPHKAREVHALFGGMNFYQSRSGLSGAGWVPNRLGLFGVAVYRSDALDHIWAEEPNILGRWTVTVPIDYKSSSISISRKSPIIVRDWQSPDRPYLLKYEHELADLLAGKISRDEWAGEWEAKFFINPEEPAQSAWLRWYGVAPSMALRRRLIANSSFGLNRFGLAGDKHPFWLPLGLRYWKGKVFVCRQGFAPADGVFPVADWQSAPLPGNILLLPEQPDMYIRVLGDGRAVAHIIDENWEYEYEYQVGSNIDEWEYEYEVGSNQIVRMMMGDRAEIQAVRDRCLAGLQRKKSLAQKREQRLAARSLGRERVLELAMGDLADVPVTRADSLSAGNCERGTDEFIQRKGWGACESVPLGVLARYAHEHGVWAVIQEVVSRSNPGDFPD